MTKRASGTGKPKAAKKATIRDLPPSAPADASSVKGGGRGLGIRESYARLDVAQGARPRGRFTSQGDAVSG